MNNNWVKYKNHIWHPYRQEKNSSNLLDIISANGVRMKLADNRELIDGISSWWVMCHGHSHPHIKEKIINQLDKLPHSMFAGLAHEAGYLLAKKLVDILPKGLNKVFYSDSGSIAVEIALKIALKYWQNKDIKSKTKFICFKDGYHGDSMGAMSVSDNPYHEDYQILLNRYLLKLPNNIDSLNQIEDFIINIKDQIAGLIIEPLVQGAGGMKFHSSFILKSIYNICRKHEILFIADEIATGFGRTGFMFACDSANITPDIICIGKALTGGVMTLAATIVTDEIYAAFYSDNSNHAFMHGPTYMANPLACSSALASIELFEIEPRMTQVKNIEIQIKQELEIFREFENIIDVRALGAIGVIEFKPFSYNIDLLRHKFTEHNIWLRPFGNIIYIMPPFITKQEELSSIFSVIYKVLTDYK